jgi:pyochelin biosynthetic protein PchC
MDQSKGRRVTEILPDSTWLRSYHDADDGSPLVIMLPHAGGSASYFFALSRALAPDLDARAVQYPGRQDRRSEPVAQTVAEIADALAPIVARLVGSGRGVTLFGHSLGATISFEVARHLEHERGTPVAGLVVSARCAPSRHRSAGIHLLDDDGLLEEVEHLSGTHSAILDDDEMRRMVLPSLRGDYRAAETYEYVPGPPLSCPVMTICGDSDPRVGTDELLGWQAHTVGPVRHVVLPGGHFYFSTDCQPLAAQLRHAAGVHIHVSAS